MSELFTNIGFLFTMYNCPVSLDVHLPFTSPSIAPYFPHPQDELMDNLKRVCLKKHFILRQHHFYHISFEYQERKIEVQYEQRGSEMGYVCHDLDWEIKDNKTVCSWPAQT